MHLLGEYNSTGFGRCKFWRLINKDSLKELDNFVVELLDKICFVTVTMGDAVSNIFVRFDTSARAIVVDDFLDVVVLGSEH